MTPNIHRAIPTLWLQRALMAALVLSAVALLIHPLGDPDVLMHLRDGQYWLESRGHVGNDPFSYTANHRPFDKTEWLFRSGLFIAYKLGGYNLLILLKAAVMTLAFSFLGIAMYKRWPNLGIVACLLLASFATPPMLGFFRERPYLFTYLFPPLFQMWVEEYRFADNQREAALAKRLIWIPVLMLAWVNLHPGFLITFGFLGAEVAEDLLATWQKPDPRASRRVNTLCLVSAAVFLAGMANPLGISIYTYVAEHVQAPVFLKSIMEWTPPHWNECPFFFIMLVLAWVAQILAWRGTRTAEWLTLAIFSYLGLKAYRNMPLFFIAALPPLAGHLRFLWNSWFPKRRLSSALQQACLAAGIVLVLGTVGLNAALNGQTLRLGLIKNYYPEGGYAWLIRHNLQGRFFTYIHWADYVSWRTHGRIKLYMDGRLMLFGEKITGDLEKIYHGGSDCIPLLEKYGIETIMANPRNDHAFFMAIDQSGQWAPVYFDHHCIVYLKRGGPDQKVITQEEYKNITPWKSAPDCFNAEQPEAVLAELQRAAQEAPASFYPPFLEGQLLVDRGRFPDAARAFQTALQRDPEQYNAYYNLGYIAEHEHDFKLAEKYLKQSLRLCGSGREKPQIAELLQEVKQEQ